MVRARAKHVETEDDSEDAEAAGATAEEDATDKGGEAEKINNNKEIKACCFYSPDPNQIDNYYACFNAFDEEDDERTIVTSNCEDRVISDSTQVGTRGKANTSKVLEDEEKDTIFGFVPVSGERDNNQHVPTVNTKPQGTEIHKNHRNFVVRSSADSR